MMDRLRNMINSKLELKEKDTSEKIEKLEM